MTKVTLPIVIVLSLLCPTFQSFLYERMYQKEIFCPNNLANSGKYKILDATHTEVLNAVNDLKHFLHIIARNVDVEEFEKIKIIEAATKDLSDGKDYSLKIFVGNKDEVADCCLRISHRPDDIQKHIKRYKLEDMLCDSKKRHRKNYRPPQRTSEKKSPGIQNFERDDKDSKNLTNTMKITYISPDDAHDIKSAPVLFLGGNNQQTKSDKFSNTQIQSFLQDTDSKSPVVIIKPQPQLQNNGNPQDDANTTSNLLVTNSNSIPPDQENSLTQTTTIPKTDSTIENTQSGKINSNVTTETVAPIENNKLQTIDSTPQSQHENTSISKTELTIMKDQITPLPVNGSETDNTQTDKTTLKNLKNGPNNEKENTENNKTIVLLNIPKDNQKPNTSFEETEIKIKLVSDVQAKTIKPLRNSQNAFSSVNELNQSAAKLKPEDSKSDANATQLQKPKDNSSSASIISEPEQVSKLKNTLLQTAIKHSPKSETNFETTSKLPNDGKVKKEQIKSTPTSVESVETSGSAKLVLPNKPFSESYPKFLNIGEPKKQINANPQKLSVTDFITHETNSKNKSVVISKPSVNKKTKKYVHQSFIHNTNTLRNNSDNSFSKRIQITKSIQKVVHSTVQTKPIIKYNRKPLNNKNSFRTPLKRGPKQTPLQNAKPISSQIKKQPFIPSRKPYHKSIKPDIKRQSEKYIVSASKIKLNNQTPIKSIKKIPLRSDNKKSIKKGNLIVPSAPFQPIEFLNSNILNKIIPLNFTAKTEKHDSAPNIQPLIQPLPYKTNPTNQPTSDYDTVGNKLTNDILFAGAKNKKDLEVEGIISYKYKIRYPE